MDDPSFPWLGINDFFPFPDPETWQDDIIAVGGNLSPGMLLSAYSQGIFPWFNEGEEILWWSLDPRFVMKPDEIYISKSMKKIIRSGRYKVCFDRDFPAVMHNCGQIKRSHEDGTWISNEMEEAYGELHRLGFAHSVEVRDSEDDSRLVGGLYGLSLGSAFFGESMFSAVPNASKIALIALALYLKDQDFSMIDCQQHTGHLESMGAKDVPREDFLSALSEALKADTIRGNWSEEFSDFPQSLGWSAMQKKGESC